MADRGIDFAGNGAQDVGGMPKELESRSLSEGGPISGGPETNKGMSTDNLSISNSAGECPRGAGITFAGGND